MNMRHAFSLVELSIVLVILGLLIGGILSGQALIRAAELRSVSTEYQKYVTATQTFRDKYFALPGDMNNATAFWGALDAGDGLGLDCTDLPSSSTTTCNGDGNGKLADINDNAFMQSENTRFWQHLANAGLIEGKFSGFGLINGVPDRYGAVPGVTNPAGKMRSSYWAAEAPCSSSYVPVCDNTGINYGNILHYGAGPTPYYANTNALLKGEEAWNIDTKMDDGKPYTGKVWARCTASGVSTTTVTDVGATYVLNDSANACRFLFANAF
jgi:prepilin-type N-terminal cleavage/methylation domain-containing protein